jgi:hypothetical protein
MKDDIKKKFIVEESDIRQDTEKLIEKALNYGRVSKNGDIIIDKNKLSQDNTVRLALVLRFLAHSIDETISESIRPTELTKVLGERVESVGSRLSQLAKVGFAKKSSYGQYVVHHYKVEKFFDELDSELVVEDYNMKQSGKSKPRRISGKNNRLYSGRIGSDIQELIDNNFFKTPRFVSEVQNKLEEEVKYHDVRTIDTTIRKTFVASRKTLKRIPNTEKGKAKWRYVNR